jgi:hypothetical protein
MLMKSSVLLAFAAAIAAAQECPVSNKITCDPSKFQPAPEKFSAKFQTDVGDFVLEVCVELKYMVACHRLS